MEKLSAKKRLNVVRLYLSGLSYDETATKLGVGKGTVANVIADLKAGRFQEAADVAEQVELLRELSLDLRRSKLTPEQCATGVVVLNRINECGLDPSHIDRWPLILKLAGTEEEAREFVRLVYSIQEVQKGTGLGLEELENRAHELERRAADLEPMSNKLKECKKELATLTGQRDQLAGAVAGLEQRYGLLDPRVKHLEKRERDLSPWITDMELRAQKAEASFTRMKRELQRLQDVGLSREDLVEFKEGLQAIAERHAIEPGALRKWCFHQLQALDKGLGLDTRVQRRRQELRKIDEAVASAKQDLDTARAVAGSLKQESANLEASIKETREKVSKEIAKIVPLAQNTVDRLGKDLQRGNEEALAASRRLRDEALEIGREIARFEDILETNEWLRDLLALARGEEGVEGKQVRVILLPMLRGTAAWLKHHKLESSSLSSYTEGLIRHVEGWKV